MEHFKFEAELWLHDGDAPWHFLTVPQDVSDEIEVTAGGHTGGFGSVRVRATVGETTWSTSLFPDVKRQAYVLPVKSEVRRKEGLSEGSRLAVTLDLLGH